MKLRPIYSYLLLLIITAMLSACSSDGAVFGIEKSTPDEFQVTTRTSLTLPPDFDLRPPNEIANQNTDGDETANLRQTIFGRKAEEQRRETFLDQFGSTYTPGELAILEKTSALEADPNIRSVIDEETTAIVKESERFTDKLLFWKDPTIHTGDVVDPTKERQRIQENEALGKKEDNGQVPIIRRASESSGFDFKNLNPFN